MTDIVYRYKNQVYLNITNKCPCKCEFCIRNTTDSVGEASNLWFEHEPSLEEIFAAIDAFDFTDCTEVVFCGYGEPMERLDDVLDLCRYIKDTTNLKTRINTNGLSDLLHGRETAPELYGLVDAISILTLLCPL